MMKNAESILTISHTIHQAAVHAALAACVLATTIYLEDKLIQEQDFPTCVISFGLK